MPPTAQRLREPAAFVLLAFGAISTFFATITFLFGPGDTGSTFSGRAIASFGYLVNPLLPAALVGAVWLAHAGSQIKSAKLVTLVALITVGAAALFGLVAILGAFGADGVTGWNKTVDFFTGLSMLAIEGVAGWLILGYYQQHAPARPAQGYAPPPAQWQQPQPPQQQWQPPQTNAPAPQPWGPPVAGQPGVPGQVPPQHWGPPQPPAPQPPQQQGFHGAPDAMMTQAIPSLGQAPQQPPQPQQQPPADGGPLGVGNWSE